MEGEENMIDRKSGQAGLQSDVGKSNLLLFL